MRKRAISGATASEARPRASSCCATSSASRDAGQTVCRRAARLAQGRAQTPRRHPAAPPPPVDRSPAPLRSHRAPPAPPGRRRRSRPADRARAPRPRAATAPRVQSTAEARHGVQPHPAGLAAALLARPFPARGHVVPAGIGSCASARRPRACAITRRDGAGPRVTTAGRRPAQQRAGAPSGAPGLLLCEEAGVPPCARGRPSEWPSHAWSPRRSLGRERRTRPESLTSSAFRSCAGRRDRARALSWNAAAPPGAGSLRRGRRKPQGCRAPGVLLISAAGALGVVGFFRPPRSAEPAIERLIQAACCQWLRPVKAT
jgi:hypothetical protein